MILFFFSSCLICIDVRRGLTFVMNVNEPGGGKKLVTVSHKVQAGGLISSGVKVLFSAVLWFVVDYFLGGAVQD